MRIAANQVAGYVEAGLYDCVYLTFAGGRHTTVQADHIAGTVTTRAGELGVIVEASR